MKINQIASNMTELHNGKFIVLFSYNTPVAAVNMDTARVFRTNDHFSKTTSSHINKWFSKSVVKMLGVVGVSDLNVQSVSQTEINGMTA